MPCKSSFPRVLQGLLPSSFVVANCKTEVSAGHVLLFDGRFPELFLPALNKEASVAKYVLIMGGKLGWNPRPKKQFQDCKLEEACSFIVIFIR